MTGQWAFVGCRYCPIERITHPAARSSRMTVHASSTVSPRPTMSPDLVTAPRLFPSVRPQGKDQRSIAMLEAAASRGAVTNSGPMVGPGETREEACTVMRELRAAGCVILSIGQYLQPTKAHWPVMRFYPPEEFRWLKAEGLALGFRHVESGPLVRSSYHAEQQATGAN